ncbi:ustYa family protein [Abortiporus biennis]
MSSKFGRPGLILIAVLVIIGGYWSLRDNHLFKSTKEYSYIGYDFPRTWDIGPLDDIQMVVEPTYRYKIESEAGIRDWQNLLPQGGGFIRLGPNNRTFSVSMIHQLRCVELLRSTLVKSRGPDTEEDPVVRHCLNYLRQMALCRSGRWLESAQTPTSLDWAGVHQCRDWKTVFDKMEENYQQSLS